MMTFTYQYDKASPKVTIKIKNGDVTLIEAIEQFELFLKAAGYLFDGELDLIENHRAEVSHA